MKKCKIEVIKTTFDEELAREYGVTCACPVHQTGQVFYADFAKPEGFCDEAWKAIYQYVFALCHMDDKICSMAIGYRYRACRSIAATTAFAQSCSKLPGGMRRAITFIQRTAFQQE